MRNLVTPIGNRVIRRRERSHADVPARGVTVGRAPIPTATGVAHRLGRLAQEHALVGTPLRAVGDSADADLREGDHVAALHARSEGAATRLLGLTWVDGYNAVVALPGFGIVEPADLAGRRLPLPRIDGDARTVDVARAAACRGFHAAIGLAGLF